MSAMTEDQASTKWCHRMIEPTGEVDRPVTCVASRCMAWRWASEGPFMLMDYGDGPEAQAAYDRYILSGWTRGQDVHSGVWLHPPKTLTGYCGLAGKS